MTLSREFLQSIPPLIIFHAQSTSGTWYLPRGHLVWGMTRWFGTWWWASCHCWPLSTPTSAQALSCESKEGKKDSEVEVISLVCGPNTYLPFISGIFSFISSLQILARNVSRTHAWQWLPCPVTQRSPEDEPHLIVPLPWAFHCSSALPPAYLKEGRRQVPFRCSYLCQS